MDEIITTKTAQAKREKDFVITDKKLSKVIKVSNEIIDDIVERLKAGKYEDFYWGEYRLEITFDRYKTGEYSDITDEVVFWIGNKAYGLNFELDELYIPKERREDLWEFFNEMKDAVKLNMTYKEYKKEKDKKTVKAELEKQQEIEDAKKVLEKYKS